MFGGKSNSNTDSKPSVSVGPTSVNQIHKDLVIQGDITGKGVLRLDGKINGNLKIEGKIIIGNSGYLEGTMECQDADISGKVMGKIIAEKNLSIKAGGYVEGEVEWDQLSIDMDGVLIGKSSKRVAKSTPKIEKPEIKTDNKPAHQP